MTGREKHELAQPVFGSAFIPWLCDMEPHHM